METVNLNNVSITAKKRPILTGVTMQLNEGEFIQLTGPNGCGKSTLLKVIAGLKQPETGTVTVNGTQLAAGKFAQDTGALINAPRFLGNLTGLANLTELTSLGKTPLSQDALAEWMEKFGLNPADKTPVRRYSTGMNQKLGLIQALMEPRKLVLLDEPCNGLDKSSKKNLLQLLADLRKQRPKTTFLVVSHEEYFTDLIDRRFEVDAQTIEEVHSA